MTSKPSTLRRTRRNVGVIGLGIIGSRVAENLRRRGFQAFVWNRTPRPVPNFVGSPGEVAELCDLVQIFVSDDDALLQMVQRMTSKLTPKHIIMAHSTVAPDTARAAAEIVERRGARFLDVPFTGSKGAAEKGELVYYVGGEAATIEEARPVLEASSKEIIEIGAVGQASAMKVATNIMTAAIGQAASEGLALVLDAGLSAEKFQLAMRHNGSNSVTLDLKLPKMLAGDFAPQFSVKHMLKDMNIASRMARISGLELGVADAARRALAAEEREGRGDDDFSSVVRNYFPDGVPLAAAPESTTDRAAEIHPTLAGMDALPVADRVDLEEATTLTGGSEDAHEADAPSADGAANDFPEATLEPADEVREEPGAEASPLKETEQATVSAVDAPVPTETPVIALEAAGKFRRFFKRGSED